jgi:hypothetical protein
LTRREDSRPQKRSTLSNQVEQDDAS